MKLYKLKVKNACKRKILGSHGPPETLFLTGRGAATSLGKRGSFYSGMGHAVNVFLYRIIGKRGYASESLAEIFKIKRTDAELVEYEAKPTGKILPIPEESKVPWYPNMDDLEMQDEIENMHDQGIY